MCRYSAIEKLVCRLTAGHGQCWAWGVLRLSADPNNPVNNLGPMAGAGGGTGMGSQVPKNIYVKMIPF